MENQSDGTQTHWIRELKNGQEGSVQRDFWNEYFEKLVRMARLRLGTKPKLMADEEDVAIEVLNSFFQRIKRGEFPDLEDRTGLWPLLVRITARKAFNQRRAEFAKKRSPNDGNAVVRDKDEVRILENIIGKEPTPEFAAQSCEQANDLMASLEEPHLRETAQLKLEGFTNREIAEQLHVIERTVERRLAVIRARWSNFD